MKTNERERAALERAIKLAGGPAAIAHAIGISTAAVCQWRTTCHGLVPPARVIAVEKATGGLVTRYELRPDIFGEKETPEEIQEKLDALLAMKRLYDREETAA